jgi:hypothetical protein
MKWGFQKDDSLDVCANTCIARLNVLAQFVSDIAATIRRIQSRSLPEAERDLATRAFRQFANQFDGSQDETFKQAAAAFAQFEKQLERAAEVER